MNLRSNAFEFLIESFESVCSNLEQNAEHNFEEVQRTCVKEQFLGIESIRRFNELISGISETCSEVVNASEMLEILTNKAKENNSICVPYGIQYETVKCINDVYHIPSVKNINTVDKFVNGQNKELINDVIKMCSNNINNYKDYENTIVQVKEIF